MKKKQSKLVTVLIPVKNGERFIGEALSSVLQQTHVNLEILVIDDNSEDETLQIVSSFEDERVTVLLNPGNGLVDALNFGITEAKGDYIARMDADDICKINRIERQVCSLEANPEVGCVTSDAYLIDEAGNKIGSIVNRKATSHSILQYLLFNGPGKPLVHPSAMFRQELLKAIPYREFSYAEDRDLWLRILANSEIRVLNEKLLLYRINSGGVSHQRVDSQLLSSTMTAVNYCLVESEKVDFYEKRCGVFKEISRIVSLELEEVSRGLNVWKKFRSALSKRQLVLAFSIYLKAKVCRIACFTPTSRRLRQKSILDRALLHCRQLEKSKFYFSDHALKKIYRE
ncbi:glycosyltransferase [Roseibacillus persicicus]|uniref:glycosyltransferase family 2 protein n=1 Tax=Roseibacillus persicicus TaxID=454148 RepID=UPI00398B5556